MKLILPLVLILASGASAATPETHCQPTDTITACWQLFHQPAPVAELEQLDATNRTADAEALLAAGIARKPQNLDSAGSPLATGSKNLFDLFSAAIENAELNDSNQDVTLTWNAALLGSNAGRDLQVQTVVHEAQLYEPLKMAIPEAQRSAQADSLGEQLGDFDDVTVSLTYAPLTQRLGRQFSANAAFYQQLFASLVFTMSTEGQDQAGLAVLQQLTSLDELATRNGEALTNGGDLTLADLGKALFTTEPANLHPAAAKLRRTTKDDTITAVVEMVEGYVRAEASLTNRVREAVGERPIATYADLLNNQPQLSISLLHRTRDELVGPDSTSVKVSYEQGFYNLNSLRRELGTGCAPEAGRQLSAACRQGFAGYVERVFPHLKQGHRLTFSGEYKETQAYDLALPLDGDTVTVQSDRAKDLRLSASYGRGISFDDEGKAVSRLDLVAAYEDVDGDDMRQDRSTVALTYTQTLNNSLQLVLGATWASKPEYLTDVDQEVSAHFGLRFRLEKKTKD